MHWERLKNKRTRIQIRKAQGRGCHGNLQQAPGLAQGPCGVGAGTCRARLPPPPRPPPQCTSADTGEGRGHRGPCQAGLLPVSGRSHLSKSEAHTQGCSGVPQATPSPSSTLVPACKLLGLTHSQGRQSYVRGTGGSEMIPQTFRQSQVGERTSRASDPAVVL